MSPRCRLIRGTRERHHETFVAAKSPRIGIAWPRGHPRPCQQRERERILDESHVLVFPSLLEGWPALVAEAVSFGMPVITTDLHGLRDIGTKDCGFLVNADNSRNLVRGIASAVARLNRDRELLSQLSRSELSRAYELSAQRQGRVLYHCYEAAFNGNKNLPS